ncbi:MAG: 3-oxoacyl-ACP reductase FabG [Synechococcales cyanobacterium T60_A2020_003]|nr:3-oxoacyl-ACP reductase FabG [Synechococcales cyanobacterium T60_A2020_003]
MKNKHVLITGGTGGLGLGVTPLVLAQGAISVTLPYVHAREVDRLKGRLSPNDWLRVRCVEADLLNETAVARMVDAMERVDAVIHLVGGFSMGNTHEYALDQWRADLDLNLTTTFLVCKHGLRRMREQGYGRIVTVGSRGAVEPGAQLASYSASKAGVVALTKAIAAETKGTNITANVVLPSVIDTPANRAAMGSDHADQWVKPDSLGEVICFLASAAAGDVRGAAIPVYGNA